VEEPRYNRNYFIIILIFFLFAENTFLKFLTRVRPFAIMIGNFPKKRKVQKEI
jgi:hypothetical protein